MDAKHICYNPNRIERTILHELIIFFQIKNVNNFKISIELHDLGPVAAILASICRRILPFSKRAYGKATWIAIPAKASMTEKADFSPVEHFACQDSWKDDIK
jgi:hypothetical protein